ncbi:hypothetical protein [Clostridium sp. BL-8]|uniref:hypothetical protein n=1 Tax=Clostridium sp. BL-8 TaxID=349938 RepID=UPI00098BDF47|nr:hypothetical protein [Clostridium sp. BL-8]OOM78445.1 hypothetical protein CLOBL_22930 [Clostridium sp. BL-8]
MKRVLISFFVAMVLMGSNIPSANAAESINSNTVSNTSSSSTAEDANTIKISLVNIQDIILEYNQQAKIYDNTRDNTKLSYDIAKDKYDTEESDYNTAVDNYNTELSDYNTALAKYNEDPANNAKPTAPTAVDKTALNTAKDSLDSARNDLRKANITYNNSLQNLVKTAQSDYISYVLGDLPNKEYNTANVDLLKKQADIAKVQYDSGFLSKNDYTTAQLNYTTALNASSKTNDAEENDKTKLLYDLGLSSGENVTFDTNLDQDLNDVSTINYNNDLTEMFNNNLTLQSDNISLEQASDDKDNYEDDNDDSSDEYDNKDEQYDNSLKNEQSQLVLDKNNAEKDFKTKYDALMNSYAAMKNGANSLSQQKDQYNVKVIQYNYGFASQQDVNTANVDSIKESQSYQSDKSAFYQAYLSYIEAKEGY